MSAQDEKPALTSGYDLAGNTVGRTMRHWFRMKTAVMGNYNTGPGIKCLLTLWVLHHFGGPIFRLRIWLNNQYRLKARVRKILGRIKG